MARATLRIEPLQRSRRQIPTEKIIAIKGNNPIADAVSTIGGSLGQALQFRNQLRMKMMEQEKQRRRAEAIGNELGIDTSKLPEGTEPGDILKLAQARADAQRANDYEFQTDQGGRSVLALNKRTGDVRLQPIGGEFTQGSKGSGYFIPRGVDPSSGQPVYSNSKRPGLFYADGRQFTGGAPGSLTLRALPSEQIDKASSFETLKFALDNIRKAYDPELVGPVATRVGKGKQYLEGVAVPGAADFYSNVADLRNQIIYLRSGKQINEAEYHRLLAALPNENMSPTDFEARMRNTIGMMNTMISSRNKSLSGSGYRNTPIEVLQPMSTGTVNQQGWTPEKAARLELLRQKKAAGTLR